MQKRCVCSASAGFVQCDIEITQQEHSRAGAKFVDNFDACMAACSNNRVQYLVYVHNLSAGKREANALYGDAPVAPMPQAPMDAYARIWIDVLEGDIAGAIHRTISEALEWPREHGEKVVHMTATTNLELELGPGFDQIDGIVDALREAFAAADLRLPPGLSKSA